MSIDYIRARGKEWGYQIRKIYLGADGWPSRTILGRLREEGLLGAASTRLVDNYRECLVGETLETGNAIKRLDEEDREILFVHFVVIGKGKVKAARLGISRTTYYAKLDRAERNLDRALLMPPNKIAPFCPGRDEPLRLLSAVS